MSVERSEAGRLNAAIASEIGELIADFTGRGANKSRAFVGPGCRRVPARGRRDQIGGQLAAAGKDELVLLQRDALQRPMGST